MTSTVVRLLKRLGPNPRSDQGPEDAVEYTVLYPPTMLWQNFQRPQNVLTQLARHHPVRCVFNDWTIAEHRYEGGRMIVTKKAFRSRYHRRPLVYYFSVPETQRFIGTRRLRPELVVFELMDLPEQEFEGWKEHLPKALGHADIIRTTSPAITEYLEQNYADALAGRSVTTSRNGVDLSLFDPERPTETPADIADIEEPILGFYGNLDWWIDWALIERLAELPGYRVVVIGDTENRADRIPTKLRDSSVRWLGRKPVGELPAYLDRFAACLIPFTVNEMTDAVDPLKLWEYLAFGKPVLATPTAFMRERAELLHLIDGDDLAGTVAAAVADTGGAAVKARREAAEGRDWRRIADELHTEITEKLG